MFITMKALSVYLERSAKSMILHIIVMCKMTHAGFRLSAMLETV